MAIASRVKFNDSAADGGAYTLSLNPSKIDLNDDTMETALDTLDGATVTQEAFFDSRPITLSWSSIPSDLAGFVAQMTVLRGYKNQFKYMHPKDIDYRVTGTGWTYIRVGNLKVETVRGGKIKYNATLTLWPTVV
jgi:hypothetical protein